MSGAAVAGNVRTPAVRHNMVSIDMSFFIFLSPFRIVQFFDARTIKFVSNCSNLFLSCVNYTMLVLESKSM